MPKNRAEPSEPRPRTPDRRLVAGQETTVLFHHGPDGTVTAHARGHTGVGRSILDALADLEREMAAALPGA